MLSKKKLAIALDTSLGWRSVYENWRDLYPSDYAMEPHWIDLSRLPARSNNSRGKNKLARIFGRLQMTKDVNLALRRGKPDAALIGNMALNLLAPTSELPIFTMIDATQQQLQDFGDAYKIYPSKIKLLEDLKHRVRCRAYQRCVGIFAFSQWAANSLIKNYGVDRTKVHVIPPGAIVQRWQSPNREMRADKICNILFVGGDFKRKGGGILLDWAARTKETNWRLHIVTKSAVTNGHPSISVYNGINHEDPRLAQLFALADIFVLPTRFDCSSLAIQEALAAGLPVVTSDVGGLPELVIEGITGYSVSIQNNQKFADRLELLIGDAQLRSRMSKAAVEDSRRRFDARANLMATLEIISSVT